MFHTHMFLLGVWLPLVSASIYPTQPIQATVWSADQPMLVSWVEDWKYPQLSEMGVIDISLWCDTDTYLVRLASGVDPMTKMDQVTVPGTALRHGSRYTIRFTTSKPIDVVVYTADFTIVPANTTTGTTITGSGDVALAATQSGTGSGFRTVVTSTGSSFSWTTSTSTTSATAPSSSPGPSTTLSGIASPSGTIPGDQRAANAGRRGVDVEKLKFRFVFVIWPVLMGITMAL